MKVVARDDNKLAVVGFVRDILVDVKNVGNAPASRHKEDNLFVAVESETLHKCTLVLGFSRELFKCGNTKGVHAGTVDIKSGFERGNHFYAAYNIMVNSLGYIRIMRSKVGDKRNDGNIYFAL